MILLWFVLATLLAFGIARFNKSNKLFWVLFISFIFGIAGGSIAHRFFTTSNSKQSKNYLTQVCPMQIHSTTLDTNVYPVTSAMLNDTVDSKESVSVGKDYTPAMCEMILIKSKPLPFVRGQPVIPFDTS